MRVSALRSCACCCRALGLPGESMPSSEPGLGRASGSRHPPELGQASSPLGPFTETVPQEQGALCPTSRLCVQVLAQKYSDGAGLGEGHGPAA